MNQFIDHPNVTAVIFAHVPGPDSGRALVSILYGDSVPRNKSAYGSLLSPSFPDAPLNLFPQSDFSESVYIDYRVFDAHDVTP